MMFIVLSSLVHAFQPALTLEQMNGEADLIVNARFDSVQMNEGEDWTVTFSVRAQPDSPEASKLSPRLTRTVRVAFRPFRGADDGLHLGYDYTLYLQRADGGEYRFVREGPSYVRHERHEVPWGKMLLALPTERPSAHALLGLLRQPTGDVSPARDAVLKLLDGRSGLSPSGLCDVVLDSDKKVAVWALKQPVQPGWGHCQDDIKARALGDADVAAAAAVFKTLVAEPDVVQLYKRTVEEGTSDQARAAATGLAELDTADAAFALADAVHHRDDTLDIVHIIEVAGRMADRAVFERSVDWADLPLVARDAKEASWPAGE